MTDVMSGYEDYQKQQESFKQSSPTKGMNYYIMAISNGKYVNCGGYPTETQATEAAYRQVGDKRFEIFPCASRDLSTVHRMFKAKLLQRSNNLDAATSLISRKPAMEQKNNTVSDFSNPQKFKVERKKEDNEHLYKGDIF